MALIFSRLQGYPRDTRLFLLYAFCSNIAVAVFVLAFNLYLIELDFREDFIGLANALQTFAMAGTAFALGTLLGRFGTWRVALTGLVAFVIFAALLSFATWSVMILVLVIFFGGASSFTFSVIMPFVVDLTTPKRRHSVASHTVATTMMATMTGSLIGGWMPILIASTFGVEATSVTAFRGALLFGIAVAAVGLVPLLLMSAERRTVSSDDDDEEAIRPGLPPLPGAVIKRRMLVFIGVGALMSIGGGMIFPFYNVYLASLGASSGQIGIIFAVASIAAALMSLFGPRLVSAFGEVPAITMGRLSPVPFFVLLIAMPGIGIATVAHLVRTSSQAIGWSTESAFMSNNLPARARRAIFGYRGGTWNVGFSFASLLGGAIIVRWGYNPTFAIYAAFILAAMGVFFFYFRPLSERPAPASTAVEPVVPRPSPAVVSPVAVQHPAIRSDLQPPISSVDVKSESSLRSGYPTTSAKTRR